MMPRALDPFLTFPRALRAAGFAASPEETESFLAAVGLLGPRHIRDIRRAAHAVFGPGPERRAAFDTVWNREYPEIDTIASKVMCSTLARRFST